jgi:hypothetical protein
MCVDQMSVGQMPFDQKTGNQKPGIQTWLISLLGPVLQNYLLLLDKLARLSLPKKFALKTDWDTLLRFQLGELGALVSN